jgi:hypothetical protein
MAVIHQLLRKPMAQADAPPSPPAT